MSAGATERAPNLANDGRATGRTTEREAPLVAKAEAALPARREALQATEPGSFAERAA